MSMPVAIQEHRSQIAKSKNGIFTFDWMHGRRSVSLNVRDITE